MTRAGPGPAGPAAALLALAIAVLAPGTAAGGTTLEPVGTYAEPVHVTSDPDDHERLYVVERAGRIQLTMPEGTSQFVDLTSVVVSSPGNERGLLSVAFPPDHATSGLLYVAYTGADGALRIGELAADGDVADPVSLRVVLSIPQPFANHNGGQLQLGPDGYLYLSIGDGGSGGDPEGHGQDPATLLGALLRIDPRESGDDPYTIPESNPYVDPESHPVPNTRPEIWSWGLRNPWRFSFDRETGALTIGDVGQMQREEVNYRPQEVGGGHGDNFGWNCREGLIAYSSPSQLCPDSEEFVDPVFNYPIFGQPTCAVTGGYVVRDPSLTDLYGRYLYADHCVGQLRSLELGLPLATDDRSEGLSVPSTSSFGEDACGRIYAASLGGAVYRLVGEEEPECEPAVDPDTTPPVTTHQLDSAEPPNEHGSFASEVGVTLSATDGDDESASGVERTEYRINDPMGPWTQSHNTEGDDPFETSFTVSTDREHTVEYRSVDNAGNEEEAKAVTFTIDSDGGGEANLRVVGQPKKRTVGPKKKQTSFRLRATNRGDAPSGTVHLCATAPKKRVNVLGQRCRTFEDIDPGQTRQRPVKLRIKPKARGKLTKIKLIARGPDVEKRQAMVTLQVRR